MKQLALAAVVAAAFLPPDFSFADGSSAHAYASRKAVNLRADMSAVLVLATTGVPVGESPIRSRAQLGAVRDVILDGVQVKMNEVDIRDRIGRGAYAVIYPDAGKTWPREVMTPTSYPPAWY